jgi:SAM-dependent methyltransferase
VRPGRPQGPPAAADGAFDRVLCHNVLEVLPDPDALVAEAIRVLRPGGRLVLAHSDFDTLISASEDLELTRRLVRDYCDTQQPWMDAVDGTIGRRLADIAGRAGLLVEDVQAAVVLGRRFLPGEIGWGLCPQPGRRPQRRRSGRPG